MKIENMVDKAYENLTLHEIAKSPVSVIQGVSEGDAKLLEQAFNIKTVEDLANLKFFKWASQICAATNDEDDVSFDKTQKASSKKLKDKENVEKQFCILYEEIGEAYEAYRKNSDELGEELGTCGVYLLQLAEMLGFSLGAEVKKELDID